MSYLSASTESMLAEFDVDPVTGFMPRHLPLRRLPCTWDVWEALLESAREQKLLPGDTYKLPQDEHRRSSLWRQRIQQMPALSIEGLDASVSLLRRAHLVLSCLLAFYVQTLPPTSDIAVPRPLAVPLLRISKLLDVPPVLTYSDTVLYNWTLPLDSASSDALPTWETVHTPPLFTDSRDEEEFYLASARIELRGAEALHLMAKINSDLAKCRDESNIPIEQSLHALASVIKDLRVLLLSLHNGCDPEGYYNLVRPWFRGEDSDVHKRKWTFEGVGDEEGLDEPEELSGPSAGQSSIIHALDVFLGVDTRSEEGGKPSFMARMRKYMPTKHRAFLDSLAAQPLPLRQYVVEKGGTDLTEAFNDATMALKEFRDSHLIIVANYIIVPTRKAERRNTGMDLKMVAGDRQPLLGTGGSELMPFLKGLRDVTRDTMLSSSP